MIVKAVPTSEACYDDIGKAYEVAFEGLAPQQASVEWVLQELKTAGQTRAKIVDIGCGTGRPVCESLAKAGHDVLGIDLSTAMVEAGRANVPDAKFEKRDMREFLQSSEPGSFDAVTVYFSMVAGLTQDDIRANIIDVHRLVKAGGLFVFATVPFDENCVEMTWMNRQFIVSSLSQDDVIASIEKVGFEVLYQNTSTFLPNGAKAGLCKQEDVIEETHLFVYAKKKQNEVS